MKEYFHFLSSIQNYNNYIQMTGNYAQTSAQTKGREAWRNDSHHIYLSQTQSWWRIPTFGSVKVSSCIIHFASFLQSPHTNDFKKWERIYKQCWIRISQHERKKQRLLTVRDALSLSARPKGSRIRIMSHIPVLYISSIMLLCAQECEGLYLLRVFFFLVYSL